ncbi:MAG: DNA translocase FtsK [Candidatus Tokpelaia hoelldobleri]|uniref:DNA translocase FtsK n=1 Tax=Candidatus Tokpelaia hoelldobleri TaxID=1902579 RepID=A0A1U9JWB8_9HYPH|nr:MAG: DNA translocase FtsK [Candidatus Tokpelaia hoelldoblerii]
MQKGRPAYDLPHGEIDETTGIVEMFSRQIGSFVGIGLLGLVGLAGVSLATWNIADPSFSYANDNPVINRLGFWGAAYADIAIQFFGLASVAVLLPPFFWGVLLLLGRDIPQFFRRVVFWLFSLCIFSTALALVPLPYSWPLPTIGLGGVAGDKMAGLFTHVLRLLPPYLISALVAPVLALFGLIMAAYAGGVLGRSGKKATRRRSRLPQPAGRASMVHDEEDENEKIGVMTVLAGRLAHAGIWCGRMLRRLLPRHGVNVEDQGGLQRIEPDFTGVRQEAAADEVSTRGARRSVASQRRHGFELPRLGYLSEGKRAPRSSALSREALDENAQLLTHVLDDFGVKGQIDSVNPGPVVTLYELEPAPGVKSSRVIGLSDDIARSTSAVPARSAVVPGRNAIGIELPNPARETVYLREMLENKIFRTSTAKLGLALGKTIGGEPVVADLSRMPHVLVAGTTGSGKSVAINTMILSLLYRMTPQECRLIMVDPKMLELSVYDGIPHLLTPVVTDPKKAVTALKWAVREMEDRYRKMAKLGVRNIDGFNARVKEALANNETIMCTVQSGFDRETGEMVYHEEALDLTPLPYIVIIVDEMADLMMVAGKDIEGAVQRLAQMARAAGIHVIMATQRPSVDVITGTIKANFPTRISFQVTSKIDSRTILGEQGAEQLLGQGDMLFMMGGGRCTRVHGPFVGDNEVEKVVAHLKKQGVPEYLDAVMEETDEDGATGGRMGNMAVSDDPYDQAVAVVLRDRKASTSYIQRRLGIGYNRAATIIERMEEEGLISAPNHAGKREILAPEQEDGY